MVSTKKIVDTKLSQVKARPVPGVRVNRTGRRTFSVEYKRAVVKQCMQPGVSVASVALEHRLNANLLRRWIVRQHRERAATAQPSERAPLLPVVIEATNPAQEVSVEARTPRTPPKPTVIEIELYGALIRIRGQVEAQSLAVVLDVLRGR